MRITDLWAAGNRPTISFELFPARTEKAAANLDKAIDKFAALRPDFVSVTFGAGGSTREGSYDLVKKLKTEIGLEVLPYFACYGLGPEDILDVVTDYVELGIGSLLAVRGDEPRGVEGFTPHPESFAHASDLLAFLGANFDNLCLGAAGYPEGHVEAKSVEADLGFLKFKVANGARFIIANYFYDNTFFFDFHDRCRALGIDVPIIPGVMPVYSVKMMHTLAGLCGATITEELSRRIAALPEEDRAAVSDLGIELATRQCRGLLERGAPGLHFYTMDRSKSVVGIVRRLRDEGLL
jgi:methylenetetrahydrofolate reductase (NADPH)